MSSFKENVTIITGASYGIGAEMARQLAEQGAWLALAARSDDMLQSVADACREKGARALPIPTDVILESECKACIEAVLAEYGRIDTLILNAGLGMWSSFEELTNPGVLERLVQVNYLGAAYCTHFALPALKQTHGRIVAVSSLAAKNGVPLRSGYAASKHAMSGFFDTLRIELARYGVSVTVAYPDFVATGTQSRNLGPDGKPLGYQPVSMAGMMDTATCARMILQAAEKRKREVFLTWRGKLGRWLQLIAPGLVDRIALRAIEGGNHEQSADRSSQET